jgi:hypothetical protein
MTFPDFDNGAPLAAHAMRRCKCCGGVQYDWNVIYSARRAMYVILWFCCGRNSCGFRDSQDISAERLAVLRQHPPTVARAPGAPWKRHRDRRIDEAA